ncbi:hypothetical protein L7F22_029529 [Adiantum nelumboides]|nr:hypothetical protein [Adiantum nelumboides]
MDAPDFDELEWMAQQEDPFPDLQVPPEFEYEHGYTGFSNSAELVPIEETGSPSALASDRKRSLSLELGADSRKRGKTCNKESFSDSGSQKVVEDEWILPQEADWSPASAKNRTDNSQTVYKADSKLPSKRLADIEGNFIPITNPSGDRVYAEVRDAQNLRDSLQSIHNPFRNPKHGMSIFRVVH